MAAPNSSYRGVVRLARHLWPHHSSPCLSCSPLRRMQTSVVYERNVDEHVRPVVVPDEIIEQTQSSSDKYWTPNPHTGVFVPADKMKMECGGATAESSSVLEQKAFFRSLEDLDKPQPLSF